MYRTCLNISLGMLFVTGIACSSTQEKEKTAPEHRAEAERHRKEARDALDGYDPSGKQVRVDPKAGTDRTGTMGCSVVAGAVMESLAIPGIQLPPPP